MPLAYSAPTTLPALVPDTTTGLMPLASSILITPMWAKPLAAPPPSAIPTLSGGGATVAGAAGGALGVLEQAATRLASRTVAKRRMVEGRPGREAQFNPRFRNGRRTVR